MNGGMLLLVLGASFGGTGVMLGAFGAHALKARLTETALQTWQTAVSYQLVHALALVLIGVWLRTAGEAGAAPVRLLGFAGGAFAVGVLFFSGSLYLLALGGPRWMGPITPVGGLAFIVGWLALVIGALRSTAGS